MDLPGILGAVLLFLGGVLSKPASELANYVVLRVVTRGEKNEDAANAQADAASHECRKALATIERELPRRQQQEDASGHRERLDDAYAALEGNAALLGKDIRDELSLVITVLRAAPQMAHESGHPEAHYDNLRTIVQMTVARARDVLGAQLRREPLPQSSQRIKEYAHALRHMEEFEADVYYDDLQEYEERAKHWRNAAGFE